MFKKKTKVNPWRPSYHCRACDEQLSFDRVMHSHGVCPKCGASSGSTVVDTVTKSYRCHYESYFFGLLWHLTKVEWKGEDGCRKFTSY